MYVEILVIPFTARTDPETRQAITDYFLTLRKAGKNKDEPITITARQNNGLYRLTKAIAKLRLSETCSKEDVEQAIEIHKASLEALKDPQTGKIDIDIIFGSGQSQCDRYRQIRDIIQDLQGNNGSSAHYNDIIAKAEEKHIGRDQAKSDFDVLIHRGEIVGVSNGFYRVI